MHLIHNRDGRSLQHAFRIDPDTALIPMLSSVKVAAAHECQYEC